MLGRVSKLRSIEWKDGMVEIIDQTQLPHKLVYRTLKTCEDVVEAINSMRVRGAPLIGVSAAFALALTAYHSKARSRDDLIKELFRDAEALRNTRATGANLHNCIERVLRAAMSQETVEAIREAVVQEALAIAEEDVRVNREIGRVGAKLLRDGDAVLTHCNPGSFGTVEYGTALNIIKTAFKEGKRIRVFATETRPKLQGARLTTFELMQEGIPVTLITDNMAAYVMERGLVNAVVVGADRIFKTGHVINKIGTLGIAIAAKFYNIPFYVAAPSSTFDLESHPEEVEIEMRDPNEVLYVGSERIAPEGVEVLNPAFDLTPPELVTAIVCEKGVITPPFEENIKEMLSAN